MAEVIPIIQESKQNQFIVQYDGTFNQIAKLTTIEVTAINITNVEAAQMIAKRTKNQERLTLLQEWDKRLWRHLGQFLREMPKNKGGNPKLIAKPTPTSKVEVKAVTIASLGLSQNQSSRAQKWARMPEKEFEETVIEPIKSKSKDDKRKHMSTLELNVEEITKGFEKALNGYLRLMDTMKTLQAAGGLLESDITGLIKMNMERLAEVMRGLEGLVRTTNVKTHILQLGKD